MNKLKLSSLGAVTIAALILGGAGCNSTEPAPANPPVVAEPAPTVSVVPQTVTDNKLTIEAAYAMEPSWITIHADENGMPGAVIGETAIPIGESKNVIVTVDVAKVTPSLYAMLHSDLGVVGTYEFPGVDAPTVFKDNVVMVKFPVTVGAATVDAKIKADNVTGTMQQIQVEVNGAMMKK